MSTRATYQFTGKHGLSITCYIHHDGYPEGAAHYLKAAVSEYGKITPDLFIRKNPNAEIAASARLYGDTDYHYTVDVDAQTITVSQRDRGVLISNDDRTMRVIHHGNFFEWINGLVKTDRLLTLTKKYGGTWTVTLSTLKKQLKSKGRELTSYRKNHPDMVGNIAAYEGEIEELNNLIAQYRAVSKAVSKRRAA